MVSKDRSGMLRPRRLARSVVELVLLLLALALLGSAG
jgi:hypothetical protein